MGDLIQLLPAVTDAAKVLPGIQFDWVAEESFTEIPKWHPNIDRVITIAHRRWKKNVISSLKSGEIRQFYHQLRAKKYDYVIDAQSNHKSAAVTLLSKGKRYGVCSQSVREYGAHFAYQHKLTISKKQHHITRMRELFAQIFDYKIISEQIDYGINKDLLPEINFPLPERFIFLTHIASRSHKLWPESYWQQLIKDIVAADFYVILPWWSKEEKQRSERFANLSSQVQLIPPMNISEKAAVISRAKAAISCDTGLAHIAAALNIPNIVFYGPTDPALVGVVGSKQVHLTANFPDCAPCLRSKCHYQGAQTALFPACLATIKPQQVFAELLKIL